MPNLVIVNGKTYECDAVSVSNTLYIDRTYAFVTVPAKYLGQEHIRTAKNDKQVTAARSARPSWLQSWTYTGQDIIGTDQTGRLMRRRSPTSPAGLWCGMWATMRRRLPNSMRKRWGSNEQ